jgi:hypothetical protein
MTALDAARAAMCARIHGGRKLYASLNSLGDRVYFERDPVDIVREMAAHNLRVGNGPPSDRMVTDELYDAPAASRKRSDRMAKNEARDLVLAQLGISPKEFDERASLNSNSRTPGLMRATGARDSGRDLVLANLDVSRDEYERRLALNNRSPLQRALHTVEPDVADYEKRVDTVLADLSRASREIRLAKLGNNGFDYVSLASELASARDKLDAMLDEIRDVTSTTEMDTRDLFTKHGRMVRFG